MQILYTDYTSVNGLQLQHTYTDAPLKTQTMLIREECCICLLLQGAATYSISGVAYTAKKGDVIILPPQTPYYLQYKEDTPCEYIRLLFRPDLLPRLQNVHIFSFSERANTYAYVLPKDLIKNTKISGLLFEIERICKEKNEYVDLRCVRFLLQLTTALNQVTLEAINRHTLSLRSTKNNLAYLCTRYINKHLYDTLSIKSISDALSISPSHLQAIFKKDVGMSLSKYVSTQKMQLANKLLQQGFSATETAQKLGYEYYATFYQVYKRIYHTSPTPARKKQP